MCILQTPLASLRTSLGPRCKIQKRVHKGEHTGRSIHGGEYIQGEHTRRSTHGGEYTRGEHTRRNTHGGKHTQKRVHTGGAQTVAGNRYSLTVWLEVTAILGALRWSSGIPHRILRIPRRIFLPANVMGISEHLHTTLRHNIKISNIRKSSINLILLMHTVILGYLKSSKRQWTMLTTICAQKQEFAVECASRPPLNMSASYHVTCKHLLKSFICTSVT